MSIEPTEEQRAAAATHVLGVCLPVIDWVRTGRVDDTDNLDACVDLARLLAEREAKLTAARDALIAAHADDLRQGVAANAELRAMVERLKAQVSALHKDAAVVAVHREAERVQCRAEADTLRARVAELEHWERIAGDRHHHAVELECREAQHLADIKALMEALKGFLVPAAHTFAFNPGERARALLARLAHYDDAKAAEGGEG